MAKRWYVVHVYSGFEKKIAQQIKEQAAQKDKSENCDRARRNLVALESNQPINTVGADGERSAMDAAQRALEIERARKLLAESCQ